MSTIATIDVPVDEFALAETIKSVAGVEFEIERVAAHESDSLTPYVWATAEDFEALQSALDDDPSIEGAALLEDADSTRLYRMNWVDDTDLVQYVLTSANATVLDAYGRDAGWTLRILFPQREGLSRVHDFADEAGLSFEIVSMHEMTGDRQGRFGLSSEQYEAVTTAAERGYYEIPRDATLDDLADELDISHQALSERIRRAHRRLVEDTLLVGLAEEPNE